MPRVTGKSANLQSVTSSGPLELVISDHAMTITCRSCPNSISKELDTLQALVSPYLSHTATGEFSSRDINSESLKLGYPENSYFSMGVIVDTSISSHHRFRPQENSDLSPWRILDCFRVSVPA